MKRPDDPKPDSFSRRGFLKGASLTVAAGSVMGAAKQEIKKLSKDPAAPEAAVMKAKDLHNMEFNLNGEKTKASVRTGHTLLETLRDQLDMTGTKLVCDHGSCGACTVLVDGKPVNSCLTLALDAKGCKVETIEGMADGDTLHPIQAAFCKEDALQCGFCTPGMVMSCKSLLDNNPAPSREETQEALAGNLCRCGTYINIFRAVDTAAAAMKGGK